MPDEIINIRRYDQLRRNKLKISTQTPSKNKHRRHKSNKHLYLLNPKYPTVDISHQIGNCLTNFEALSGLSNHS